MTPWTIVRSRADCKCKVNSHFTISAQLVGSYVFHKFLVNLYTWCILQKFLHPISIFWKLYQIQNSNLIKYLTTDFFDFFNFHVIFPKPRISCRMSRPRDNEIRLSLEKHDLLQLYGFVNFIMSNSEN